MRIDKEFETTQETSERLNVTARTIQKWAATGKIPGAIKYGNVWMIPKGITLSRKAVVEKAEEYIETRTIWDPESILIDPLDEISSLLNSPYSIGQVIKHLDLLTNEHIKKIAFGEYYFFKGEAKKAVQLLESYHDNYDTSLSVLANMIYTLANLECGNIYRMRLSIINMQERIQNVQKTFASPQYKAVCALATTAVSISLHMPISTMFSLQEYIQYLPDGLKIYACYLLAYKACVEGNYTKCLAISETALALYSLIFPIPSIYLHITAAAALVNMRRIDEAREHIEAGSTLAKPDDIIEPFIKHHGLLLGMVEVYFKKNYPVEFVRITKKEREFRVGWYKVQSADANTKPIETLTTTEYAVAMLYNRGWMMKEIAGHLSISINTVRSCIKSIFNKLSINRRSELRKYVLL